MTSNSVKKPSVDQSIRSVYVAPYRTVLKSIGVDLAPGEVSEIKASPEQIVGMIKLLLRGVAVDEGWYRRAYPDVAQAIEDGEYKSAKHHFVENGYFEGRRPGRSVVDEAWYLAAYSDVAEGVAFGDIVSCQEHFDTHGEAEGRLPHEY